MAHDAIDSMKLLSPCRNTTLARDVDALVAEQLAHFGIDASDEFGRSLASLASNLYRAQADVDQLWRVTIEQINRLDHADRVARFNAKKFLSFQLAKILDTLQHPTRRAYQGLGYGLETHLAKGPYAPIDNVAALFSATPVIARTATYIYACAEWISDAFEGKELLLEIYSRLLNPTSVALANYIVDLEAGPYAPDYFAWNFASGMAAVDTTLAHLLGQGDVLIHSPSLYGGVHQLVYDWYAKPSNLNIGVERFEGVDVASFEVALQRAKARFADRLEQGRRIYLHLESPGNPHGDVLDVPGICRLAHQHNIRVTLDATVATPFLARHLQHADPQARPDFLIHSYTKDLSGAGGVTAGCVIARNHDMFIPKGQSAHGISWDQTLFWNVYYIKGAFLHPDSAFDVMQGIKTLEGRMLTKCINTIVLARFLDAHPMVTANCPALPAHHNHAILSHQHYLGLPAPLFTADFGDIPRATFARFFDNLSPTFAHMISLGQNNTIISCPSLTTHSELSPEQLLRAGISPAMVRIAVGDESPVDLVTHLIEAARISIDPDVPGYSSKFPTLEQARVIIRETYLDVHRRHIEARLA